MLAPGPNRVFIPPKKELKLGGCPDVSPYSPVKNDPIHTIKFSLIGTLFEIAMYAEWTKSSAILFKGETLLHSNAKQENITII